MWFLYLPPVIDHCCTFISLSTQWLSQDFPNIAQTLYTENKMMFVKVTVKHHANIRLSFPM